MGRVVRYAQNSFSSLSTPALNCLLELAPHAPFFIPEVSPTGVSLYLVHHHSGPSEFLLQHATSHKNA